MGLALSRAEASGGAAISVSSGGAVISGGATGSSMISGGATGGSEVISGGYTVTGGAEIVTGPISSVSSLSMTSRRYIGILVDTWPPTR